MCSKFCAEIFLKFIYIYSSHYWPHFLLNKYQQKHMFVSSEILSLFKKKNLFNLISHFVNCLIIDAIMLQNKQTEWKRHDFFGGGFM